MQSSTVGGCTARFPSMRSKTIIAITWVDENRFERIYIIKRAKVLYDSEKILNKFQNIFQLCNKD